MTLTDHNDYVAAAMREPRPTYARADLAELLSTTAEQWIAEGDAREKAEESEFAGAAHRWPWDVIMYAQRLAFQHGEEFALARLNGAPFEWRAAA